MKITLTAVFVWKDGTGAIKTGVSGANEEVYTVAYGKNGLPTVTDITSACVANLAAVDATSGIFNLDIEWNPTSIDVDEFIVVVRDGTGTAHVHMQAIMPRTQADHIKIRLR